MKFPTRKQIAAAFAAFLLLLTSCTGGTEETQMTDAPDTPTEKTEVQVTGLDLYRAGTDVGNSRVFYEIFVGSFSDSDGDGTGDLRGIINRMDYLNDGDPASGKSLGVEGLWLTPIFKSGSYHKYDTDDYYAIDPKFGTMSDLEELVRLCHERGVKLILDLVINHTSTAHEWFKRFSQAQKNLDDTDPYFDYYSYYRQSDGKPEAGKSYNNLAGTDVCYECNFSGGMPEPDYDNELVREQMLDVAKFYLDLGVDGFRFDAAKYIYYNDNVKSVEFWNWYLGELRKIKPDLYAVAEVWDGPSVINRYYEAVDCFDFAQSQASGIVAETARGGDANRYAAYVADYLKTIEAKRDGAIMMSFITNHDMDRAAGFLTEMSGQMQVAANLYVLTPGSPFLYYGEEIGMRGSRGAANTDANRRLAMLWGDDDRVKDPSGTTYKKENQTEDTVADQLSDPNSLYNYYKKLLLIRKAHPEIACGTYEPVKLEGTKLGGFVSTLEGSSVLVLHNPGRSSVTYDLSTVKGGTFKTLSAFIGMEEASLDGTTLTVGGQTSVILR